MFQNILYFLSNWPIPWLDPSIVGWGIIFQILNFLNLLILGLISIMSYIDEDCNLFKYIYKNLNIKTSVFYLLWIIILPLSTILVLLFKLSITILIILISWIFDIKSETKDNFIKWIKKILIKEKVINKKDYKDICISKCKYGMYSSNLDLNNNFYAKCTQLDMEFSRNECPCEGKLFEGDKK